ncbi:hypothetical protein F511_26990 [Dorcoceras hygrometricum]|uniref:Uncharacterized protein n=1 Tax=Dorcoceras hygrometricum TaxID=472368 RepID=A0A2Z7CGH4_9LAMI|nr:hypothetical protein F511_26990 [Dorcoceras hygrometricum]
MLNTLSSVTVRESQIQYLCDPQWFRDTASRGPTTIVAPESQFRTCPTDHDSIGYPRMSASGESSTTMHRLLHALGSHPIPPPNDPNIAANSRRNQQLVTNSSQLVPDAIPKMQRFNLSKRCRLTSTTGSSNQQLVTQTQPHSHNAAADQSYQQHSTPKRHHTTKLRNELKSTAEGFDIKIDVLERTLTQRLIDELAVVKSQLACLVEDFKGSGAAKKGEGGSSSRPREGPSIRGPTGVRGRNDDPERFKYSKWF